MSQEPFSSPRCRNSAGLGLTLRAALGALWARAGGSQHGPQQRPYGRWRGSRQSRQVRALCRFRSESVRVEVDLKRGGWKTGRRRGVARPGQSPVSETFFCHLRHSPDAFASALPQPVMDLPYSCSLHRHPPIAGQNGHAKAHHQNR